MRAGQGCPVCGAPGHLIGRDERARSVFACLTAGCDMVEYDHEVIRHRKGGAFIPSVTHRIGWNIPSYWARRSRVDAS